MIIPDICEVVCIIPILKTDKSATNEESYRPISLLSPVAKVLESLLIPSMKEYFPLDSHDFRTGIQLIKTTELSVTKFKGFHDLI